LFAADYIAALDGVTVIRGGWINRNWIQLLHQLTDAVTGFSYSFGVTCIILFVMNLIPCLSLRVSDEAEIMGIDEAEIGEFAYDFVEKERDYIHLHTISRESRESIAAPPSHDQMEEKHSPLV
jgi:ammonium transporter, Amt family